MLVNPIRDTESAGQLLDNLRLAIVRSDEVQVNVDSSRN
jgi:hypothetical protein